MHKTHDSDQLTFDEASEYWINEIDSGFANKADLPYIGPMSYGSYVVKYQSFDEAVNDLMADTTVCKAFIAMLRFPHNADVSAFMSVMQQQYTSMWLDDLINHSLGR